MLQIDGLATIPLAELRFFASRSSGPGGQHANKVSSRVTLEFDLEGSPSLDEAQKARLREVLPTRITNDGRLLLHAQKFSSQHANRELLKERFVSLLAEALRPRRQRKATRPTTASKRRRLDAKRKRSEAKRLRGRVERD